MGWLIIVADSVASALLLNAGVAKIVSPGRLGAALAELSPRGARITGDGAVRSFAVAELIVAVWFLIIPWRAAAAVAAGALGSCFCVVGALGLRTGQKAPCGCFGASSQRPFGRVNIAVGIALAAVAPLNFVVTQGVVSENSTSTALGITAAAAVLLSLWINRHPVVRAWRRA